MKRLIVYFIKRLPREGYKSVSASALALALVFLLNLLGALKSWQEAEYEKIMDEFPVYIEICDLSGSIADMLFIEEKYIELFCGPAGNWQPVDGYVKDVMLKRELDITGMGALIGINDISAAGEVSFTFFGGYDEGIFKTGENVCLVSEDILESAENGVLRAEVRGKDRSYQELIERLIEVGSGMYRTVTEWVTRFTEPVGVETEFLIIGTASGVGAVYCPYLTAGAIGAASDEYGAYTDSLSAVISDNRRMNEFKRAAWWHFPKGGTVYDSRPVSMIVYDSQFYDKIVPMMQNIILIDAAAPFVYAAAVCIGFVASYLITRRRRHEFALMRSMGAGRLNVFFCALAEQAALCAIGAVLGALLSALCWGYISAARAAIFLACYTLGAAFSAARAADSNVLKILREKE